MNFDLEAGLYISNPFFSIILLILWGYIVWKYFEISLSIIVVGSFILQYSEVNLFVWQGTLLLPIALLLFFLIFKQFINISRYLSVTEKRIVTIVSLFFIFQIISNLLKGGSAVIISTNFLFSFTRLYLPFYGVFILLQKKDSLMVHIKYNAYMSLFICFGYILTIFNGNIFQNIISLRTITFWNMPIGGFSSLALWSFFYFASKLTLAPGETRKYMYFLLVLPILIVFISQSRGLLPSIIFGFVGILSVSKNKMKGIIPALTGLVIILIVLNNINFNFGGFNESVTNVYLSRFDENGRNTSVSSDSRFSMNKEAWASILEHPLGGATIESKVGIHNFYLAILMQFGIFGFLYMMLLYLSLKPSVKFIYKTISKVTASHLIIIAGVVISILFHTLIAGLLGGVDTLFYWSIAMILVLRKEITSHIQSRQAIEKSLQYS